MRSQSNRYFRYFTYIKPATNLPIIRTYGSVIFSLLTMTVFILFAVKPTIETILILQKKLADAEQIVNKINLKAVSLSQARENYRNLSSDIKNRIQSIIPDSANLKSVIQTLEQSAKTNEASISALQIQPLTLETKESNVLGSLAEVSFTFNVEGSYQNLIGLLQDLKRSSRLISVDRLTFNKTGEEKVLILSISGKAYYIK